MFQTLLKRAYDFGNEVVLDHAHYGNYLKGRVLDLDDTHFTLFNSGAQGGILWAFKQEDILYLGLVMEPPTTTLLEGGITETDDPFPTTQKLQQPQQPFPGKGTLHDE
jgi:hypothetical protein